MEEEGERLYQQYKNLNKQVRTSNNQIHNLEQEINQLKLKTKVVPSLGLKILSSCDILTVMDGINIVIHTIILQWIKHSFCYLASNHTADFTVSVRMSGRVFVV